MQTLKTPMACSESLSDVDLDPQECSSSPQRRHDSEPKRGTSNCAPPPSAPVKVGREKDRGRGGEM